MKKIVLFIIFLSLLNATTLKSMLNSSKLQNDLVLSKDLEVLSSKKSIGVVKSSYLPTVDIGGFAQSLYPKTPMMAGTAYGVYAKLNYTIYDGKTKKYTLRQKRFELLSKEFESLEFKRSLALLIIKDYFEIKSLDSLLLAIKSKKKSLLSSVKKAKYYFKSGLIESSEVDRLKAELEMVNYNISSLKLQKATLLSDLSLKVGKKIKNIDNAYFIKKRVKFSVNNEIKSILAKSASVSSEAKIIKSANNPKVNLGIEYDIYGYERYDLMHPRGVDKQAKVSLNANMRVYDGGVTKEKAQIAKIQALSIALQAKHKLKEQKSNFNLAKLRIRNIKNKIKSAKVSFNSANRFFKDTEKKYKAGFIDNSLYLDALAQKTEALAEYKRALNDLEVAYGLYYYYAGKNLKGYIK